MTAPTLTRPAPATIAGRVSFPGVLRSEVTKLRSLRSTWWTLAVAVFVIVGFGALVAANVDPGSAAFSSPGGIATESLFGVLFAQLAVAVLGVLMISGEYGTGMIRTSMTAVPKRLPVLWAKAAVYVAVVLPVSAVAAFVSFFLSQSIRSGRGVPTAALGDPEVLRNLLGSALYVTVAGLLAMGIATLLRHTAAGLAAVVGLFFVVPIVANFLPQSLTGFIPYLPSNAGGALFGLSMSNDSLAPWTGFGLLALYTVVVLVAAAFRLRRSDV